MNTIIMIIGIGIVIVLIFWLCAVLSRDQSVVTDHMNDIMEYSDSIKQNLLFVDEMEEYQKKVDELKITPVDEINQKVALDLALNDPDYQVTTDTEKMGEECIFCGSTAITFKRHTWIDPEIDKQCSNYHITCRYCGSKYRSKPKKENRRIFKPTPEPKPISKIHSHQARRGKWYEIEQPIEKLSGMIRDEKITTLKELENYMYGGGRIE